MTATAKARRTPGAKVFGDDGWDKRIRLARENAGLSVEEAAKAMGVSVSAIRQWEGGHKFPSRENLQELAGICAVDMVYLVTGFSGEELRIAEKIVGMRPVPLLSLGQVQLIEPGSQPEWPADTSAIIPSFPCSPQAFAIEVFDHNNAPDFEVGDIVIIDPAVKPVQDDLVLVMTGPAHVFARYVVRSVDLHVYQKVRGALISRLKRSNALFRALEEEEALRIVESLVQEALTGENDALPKVWLMPTRGELIPFDSTGDRILGTMVEHRHPRRALSTGSGHTK
jgi:transcriptional regulator with XRE-family HTH domain